MTADELRALAARVEQALGPDRELDNAIMGALFRREQRHIGVFNCDDDTPALSDVWVDPATDDWVSTHAHEFTSSLDAALTLVPAELWWRVSVVAGRPSANVRTGSIISPGTKEWEGHAATPALALTAAALRARAEEAGDV